LFYLLRSAALSCKSVSLVRPINCFHHDHRPRRRFDASGHARACVLVYTFYSLFIFSNRINTVTLWCCCNKFEINLPTWTRKSSREGAGLLHIASVLPHHRFSHSPLHPTASPIPILPPLRHRHHKTRHRICGSSLAALDLSIILLGLTSPCQPLPPQGAIGYYLHTNQQKLNLPVLSHSLAIGGPIGWIRTQPTGFPGRGKGTLILRVAPVHSVPFFSEHLCVIGFLFFPRPPILSRYVQFLLAISH